MKSAPSAPEIRSSPPEPLHRQLPVPAVRSSSSRRVESPENSTNGSIGAVQRTDTWSVNGDVCCWQDPWGWNATLPLSSRTTRCVVCPAWLTSAVTRRSDPLPLTLTTSPRLSLGTLRTVTVAEAASSPAAKSASAAGGAAILIAA